MLKARHENQTLDTDAQTAIQQMSAFVIVITHLYCATPFRRSSHNNTKPQSKRTFFKCLEKKSKNQGTQGTFNNQQITNF